MIKLNDTIVVYDHCKREPLEGKVTWIDYNRKQAEVTFPRDMWTTYHQYSYQRSLTIDIDNCMNVYNDFPTKYIQTYHVEKEDNPFVVDIQLGDEFETMDSVTEKMITGKVTYVDEMRFTVCTKNHVHRYITNWTDTDNDKMRVSNVFTISRRDFISPITDKKGFQFYKKTVDKKSKK